MPGLSIEDVAHMDADELEAAVARYGILCECSGDATMRCHEASEGLPCIVNAIRHPEAYRGYEKTTTGVAEPSTEEEPSAWMFEHGDARVTVHDLHVDGDEDCGHDFTPWDITSGAEANEQDGPEAVIGWIRMESRCEWCPGRVGRLSVAHLVPDGTRP